MRSDIAITGAPGFLGAGIYTSVPARLPAALRGREAVVSGATPETAGAVLRLLDWCRSVTLVERGRKRLEALGGRPGISILRGSEIVCVDGIGRLECVVVRNIRTGAITAHTAAALFLLSPTVG